MRIRIRRDTISFAFFSCLVLLIGYFTYFRNYSYPSDLFWDENYYIAAAYKYLDGQMFMSDHPPLGKLLIALGEYIFHPNTHFDTAYFLTTDHLKDVPNGFSFIGVRFFPVVFATLAGLLFFLVLYQLSKNSYLAFLFSTFYLFDNALIVHSRGAMLDGVQIFFLLLALWYFLRLMDKVTLHFSNYVVLGVIIGFALSAKLSSGILLFLFFPLFWIKRKVGSFWHVTVSFFKYGVVFFLFVLLPFLGVYYVHGLLASHVLHNTYFRASLYYKTAIIHKQTYNPVYLPTIVLDNLLYIFDYEKGIPQSDSNGSQPFLWPFGGKTINYRWESENLHTKYLYLVGNPSIWFAGVLGLLGTCFVILRDFILTHKIRNPRLFFIMMVLCVLYMLYMGTLFSLQRVMYLYHYFIPLLLSLLLLFCVYLYLFKRAIQRQDKRVVFFTLFYIVLVVLAYSFFSPLTYYFPMTKHDFLMRSWFWFWGMKPI